MTESIRPFRIDVASETLRDVQQRLAATRWPQHPRGLDWDAGTNHDYLRALVDHWRERYDWRSQEAALNRFAQFTVDVDDVAIHFVHERGKGPRPFPLLLTHGYPDSFYRFAKLIPMLTDPVAFGGRAEDAFDVVVPDLPGYGFSRPPRKRGTIFRVNDLWARLMTRVLGYARFGAHGGDWGGTVTEQLARSHADTVVAIHLTDVPFGHALHPPDDPSAEERRFLKEVTAWTQKEGAYALIQSTRPQSLSVGLNDSPAGLAAWLVDKYRAWSDCGGDVESRFTKDELITAIMIYWVTGSIGTSFLPYFEYANAGAVTWMKEGFKQWTGSSKVPAAFARFPHDISHPPRTWAERYFHVRRWTEMPRGGHFAAMEEPALLAEDLRAWYREFR
jgi:pimeloyl-ACP methyl ester carboxylesterase